MQTKKITGSGLSTIALASGMLTAITSNATGVTILPGGAGAIGTETVEFARFVQVMNNGNTSRRMDIGEIEAFVSGVTPAVNNAGGTGALNPTTDRATLANGASEHSKGASSGGFSQPHGSNSTTLINGTENTAGGTWSSNGIGSQVTIDLGNSFDIDLVRVHQRNDGCCQDRLRDFSVNLFGDDGGNPGLLVGTVSIPGQPATNEFGSALFGTPNITIGAGDTLKIEIDPTVDIADLFLAGALGTGTLNIDPGASLEISLLSGFQNNQEFQILGFGQINGQFTNIIAPEGYNLDDLYGNGSIDSIIPEPATATLAMLGLGGLMMRRRRAA